MPSVGFTLALALLAMHPESLSSSRITVTGAEAAAVIRCQALSLSEVLPELDVDADGHVTEAEILLARSDVIDYVATHYQLQVGTDRSLEGGTALRFNDSSLHWVDDVTDPLLHRDGSVDVHLQFTHSEPITDLVVAMTLFEDTSPDHIDLTTIDWGDDGIDTFGLDAAGPRHRSDPIGRGAFAAFFGLGVRHILGGWDHLAFVGALILASRRLRSLLAVITGFTAAHSTTLVLSSLDIINVAAFAGTIEVAIALSIVFVALDTLFAPTLKRPRWIEALVFGLLHGLGFATFLSQSLVHEPNRLVPLGAFNVGVEAGQIAMAIVAVAILRLIPSRSDDREFLAPSWIRLPGLLVIASLGSWWAVGRLL